MSVIQSIIDSHSITKGQWACYACGSDRYWRSVYGNRHCWGCDPAPVESMVAESNLVEPTPGTGPKETEVVEDVGWVECTDGRYRDYFMDGGKMWLVDEWPDFVGFTLVR